MGGVGRHFIWNSRNVPGLDLRPKHRNMWGNGVPGSQDSKLTKAPTTRVQVPPNRHTRQPAAPMWEQAESSPQPKLWALVLEMRDCSPPQKSYCKGRRGELGNELSTAPGTILVITSHVGEGRDGCLGVPGCGEILFFKSYFNTDSMHEWHEHRSKCIALSIKKYYPSVGKEEGNG